MTWISAEDRLPDFDVPVLAVRDGIVFIAAREEVEGGWAWGRLDGQDLDLAGGANWFDPIYDGDEPTHWMPIPVPPGYDR